VYTEEGAGTGVEGAGGAPDAGATGAPAEPAGATGGAPPDGGGLDVELDESDLTPPAGGDAGAGAEGDAGAGGDGAGDDADPFDDDGVQSFDRGYVRKLRDEAAAARTEKATFEQQVEQQVNQWQQEIAASIKGAANGDAKAQAFIAEYFGPDAAAALTKGPGSQEDDPNRPLTAAELDAQLEARQKQAEEEQQIAENRRLLEAAGLEPSESGLPHPHIQQVLNIMRQQDKTLAEAIDIYKADYQAFIEQVKAEGVREAVDRKKAARESSARVAGGGTAGGTGEQFDLSTPEGRKAKLAFLNQQRAAGRAGS
jgi:hypothetical protein